MNQADPLLQTLHACAAKKLHRVPSIFTPQVTSFESGADKIAAVVHLRHSQDSTVCVRTAVVQLIRLHRAHGLFALNGAFT